MFHTPKKLVFKIENENDLHCKVVNYIRRCYEKALISASLGGNQDTSEKRIDSHREGYMKWSRDIIMQNKRCNCFCIEFKTQKIQVDCQTLKKRCLINIGRLVIRPWHPMTMISLSEKSIITWIILHLKCIDCGNFLSSNEKLMNHNEKIHK